MISVLQDGTPPCDGWVCNKEAAAGRRWTELALALGGLLAAICLSERELPGRDTGVGSSILQLYDQTPKVLQPDLSGALKHRWMQVEGETGLPWLH